MYREIKMKKNITFLFGLVCFGILGCTSSKKNDNIGLELDSVQVQTTTSTTSTKRFTEANNEFAYKTFSDILTDYSTGNIGYINGKNIVYSPYSYIRALSLFNKIAEPFNSPLMEIVRKFDYEEIGSLHNIVSADILLLNDRFYKAKALEKNMSVLSFPKQAEAESIKLQNNILKEVLLEPKYDKDMACVVINATRFLGYWLDSFNKYATSKQDFTLVSGKKIKSDIMSCTITDTQGFEDNDVALTFKSLSETSEDKSITSNVYVIVPKTDGLDEKSAKAKIANVACNIKKYLENLETYDKVFLRLPKIKTKTSIDLLEMADAHGYKLRGNGKFHTKYLDRIKDISEGISGIRQVASLEVDEEKVEAKAVTEIVTKATAVAPQQQQRILYVNADVPHFIVITSVEDGVETISFMCLITEPSV